MFRILKHKISTVLRFVFPSGKDEWLLFSLFVVAYGTLATRIALGYRIVFDNRIPWDAYFSFDNRAIVMTGGGFERHPLSNYFFEGISKLALWISDGKYNADFRLVLSWFSVLAVSLALIQIYKYFRNVIALPVAWCWFLVLFFSVFSTNILLSFTPETYTYSLLFLSLFNYYSARKLKNDKKIGLFPMVFAIVGIGGLTITNAVKVFIPLIFERKIFNSFKVFANAFLRGLISVGVFVFLVFARINFDWQRIFTKAGEQYEKFSNPKTVPFWDMLSSWFLGGNVLLSSYIVRDYHNTKGFQYKALFMDVYSSWASYVFVGMLVFLVVWSIVVNVKNKLAWVLVLSFFCDILIHCVLKFGLHTSYIYGGHFVFVYPLMLGWLVSRYKKYRKILSGLGVVLFIMFIYLYVNNFVRMEEFFQFLQKYYR